MRPRSIAQIRSPLEEDEQRALVAWVDHQPWSRYFFHVPNERSVSVQRQVLAGLGVRAGLPDNWLALPRGPFLGHVHELKRRRGGRVRSGQSAYLDLLGHAGWHVAVYRGASEAIDGITLYLATGESTWQTTQ